MHTPSILCENGACLHCVTQELNWQPLGKIQLNLPETTLAEDMAASRARRHKRVATQAALDAMNACPVRTHQALTQAYLDGYKARMASLTA